GAHQLSAWRLNTPKAKFQRGMRDLRDPVVRAELCMSCHIGNVEEGKVVTHAMMAAGHPPLPPIELAAFSRNLPRHCREARDVPWVKENKETTLKDVKGQPVKLTVAEAYHLKQAYSQTLMALIANVVATRETMKLVQHRADFSVPDTQRLRVWPEIVLSQE